MPAELRPVDVKSFTCRYDGTPEHALSFLNEFYRQLRPIHSQLHAFVKRGTFLCGAILFTEGSFAWMAPAIGDSAHGAPLWEVQSLTAPTCCPLAGSAAPLSLLLLAHHLLSPAGQAQATVTYPYFIGSTFFLIGTYLAFVEVSHAVHA